MDVRIQSPLIVPHGIETTVRFAQTIFLFPLIVPHGIETVLLRRLTHK